MIFDFSVGFIFVYVATYTFVALYCIVLLARLSSDIGRQLEVRFFRLVIIALLIYCITESIWAVGNFGYSSTINRFNIALTIVNSIMVNAMCYLWFCYIESYLRSPIVNNLKLLALASIPFAIAVLLSLSSIWTDWVFLMNPDGTAGRGPLYIVIIIIAYVYAAIATVRSIVGAVRATDRHRRRELVTMSLFVIPPAAVGVIDTLAPMMPIVAPAFFFSFLIVFTMLQESQISTDSLTGLNNRRRAEQHFDEVYEEATPDEPAILFVIDADGFKAINDTYGHMKGDEALCMIASALRHACSDVNALAARWGGDEFVVVSSASEIGAPDAFVAKIERCLDNVRQQQQAPYRISVSVGYAYYDGSDTSKQQVFEAADNMLYEMKARKTAAEA